MKANATKPAVKPGAPKAPRKKRSTALLKGLISLAPGHTVAARAISPDILERLGKDQVDHQLVCDGDCLVQWVSDALHQLGGRRLVGFKADASHLIGTLKGMAGQFIEEDDFEQVVLLWAQGLELGVMLCEETMAAGRSVEKQDVTGAKLEQLFCAQELYYKQHLDCHRNVPRGLFSWVYEALGALDPDDSCLFDSIDSLAYEIHEQHDLEAACAVLAGGFAMGVALHEEHRLELMAQPAA